MNEAQPIIPDDEVSDLLQKLIQFDSCNPPGREEPVAEFLADVMAEAGLEVTLMRFAPDRANVLGRWRGVGDQPALLFNGHLDTVPVNKEQWQHDPHAGLIEDGILHGRGTVDMKGGVAAMVMACAALARAKVRLAGDVVFAGTAGEEVDCIGSQQLLTQDLGPIAGLVVGEPTSLEVVPAHKGALWVEISTTGKAAHGSMPEQGHNAILAMHRLVERLLAYRPAYRAHPLLGPPTLNLGTIHGGVKTNIVADQCVLTVDMRSVPGQNHETLIQDIQRIIDALEREEPDFRATLRVQTDRPPVETSTEDPLIQAALRVGQAIFDRSLTPKLDFVSFKHHKKLITDS
uniref:M20 family metallopeptidase n=1 Tax=Candidatus Entotheonella palauensis TaxID=93172 RepID=UPI000B7DCFC1